MKRETTRDLLIELGTEELPASAQQPLAEALAAGLRDALDTHDIVPAKTVVFSTPRRLAVLACAIPVTEPERAIERKGPSLQAAFDATGKPTRAAEGFARSVGVTVAELETLDNAEGKWLIHRRREPGRQAVELLAELLPQIFATLPLPRRMRWGAGDESFLRPVRWLTVRYGKETVAVQAFGLAAGGTSQGHRFHHPGAVKIAAPQDYPVALLAARVIADPAARLAEVERLIGATAAKLGGTPAAPAGLYAEIAGMLEWPVAVAAHFDRKYLALPEPVLITTLAHHQRFVPIRGADGKLLPAFVAILNLESRDPERLCHGLERVVRPRLEDAAFYYRRDRERALADYAKELAGLAFGEKLGSMAEKSARLKRLAAEIATAIGADVTAATRAAELAKCDLATGMVFEFPELQGVIGGVYAASDGESEAVAQAIAEQYLPAGAGDGLPQCPTGVALALADRLDTLVGGFAGGREPTGAKDPFGLRRAAFGVLRIAAERTPDLDVVPWLEAAAALYPAELKAAATLPALTDFLRERLRSTLLEQGHAADLVQAVLAVAPLAPGEVLARAAALARFRDLPEAEALAVANKRIANILRQAGAAEANHPEPNEAPPPAEAALAQELAGALPALDAALEKRDFDAALTGLSRLRDPVDRFFDEVMVMDADPAIRARRLALLAGLRAAFLKIADVGELQGIEKQ
ncbi:MAG: glycine--tRNA ligase subunit beta [Gammaproteobacteria bacterium]